MEDPIYGSHGASRMTPDQREAFKQYMHSILATYFPGKTWEQIPCASLTSTAGTALANATSRFPNSTDTGACESMKRGDRGISFTTLPADMAGWWEAMAGEKLCSAAPPQLDTPGHWFEYNGPCSWEPTEWQQMVDAMVRWFAPHAALGPTGWWNEIVAAWPASASEFESVAQALFYITAPEMDAKTIAAARTAALQNAAMYGGRPVLILDSVKFFAGGPLFECAEEERGSST